MVGETNLARSFILDFSFQDCANMMSLAHVTRSAAQRTHAGARCPSLSLRLAILLALCLNHPWVPWLPRSGDRAGSLAPVPHRPGAHGSS